MTLLLLAPTGALAFRRRARTRYSHLTATAPQAAEPSATVQLRSVIAPLRVSQLGSGAATGALLYRAAGDDSAVRTAREGPAPALAQISRIRKAGAGTPVGRMPQR